MLLWLLVVDVVVDVVCVLEMYKATAPHQDEVDGVSETMLNVIVFTSKHTEVIK